MIENIEIKYSIIIPHYNTVELLRRCINSIPDRSDIQIIIVDDNSSEKQRLLLDSYKIRNNVEIIYSKSQNLGGGAMRNIGLKKAKGKWILFADADDFFVENFSSYIDDYYSSDFDVVYFAINYYDENDLNHNITSNQDLIMSKYLETNDEKYLRFCYTEPWGKMFKHSFLLDNNISFQESFVANDFLFSVSSGYYANKITLCENKLYNYIRYSKSVSKVSKNKILERMKVNIGVQHFFDSKCVKNDVHLAATCIVLRYYDMYGDFLKIIVKNHINLVRLIFSFMKYKLMSHVFKTKFISGFVMR